MIALIRKNLRLWGYGKSLALFAGCILFSISGRLNGGTAYERHILSAVSDHYYLTYFVLPIVLLSCFSFIDDDGEPIILRFQSYHSYFLKKWIGVGLIAVILTAVQTGAILLSGIGLPLGNEWNLAAGATEAELFSTLEQLFASPLQAFVCFTLYQLIGSWLIFGICMWIGHFTGRKWTIRIVIVLYVLSAVWIKLPAIQNIPLTSFNHLLILHHNLGVPHRLEITAFTLLLIVLIIAMVYAIFWLMAGLIGASLFSTGLTIVSFRFLLYAVLMKCLDILAQYLIMLGIYIATRQVTIGFLVLVAGNLLCVLPGNWVAYSPFGLSSLTRISVVEPGIGISAVSAFGIEAAISTLMIAGILMCGYKKILN